jgi:hypothetical protein
MECKLLYENHPFPGDEVYVDFQSMGIPKIKDYDTVGMIVMENKPIHTYVYKVMLYSNNLDNTLKIIEVPIRHLKIVRYINRDHFGV